MSSASTVQSIFGKWPHKQKHCWCDICFLFFCCCPEELSVTVKHLEVSLRPESLQAGSCGISNVQPYMSLTTHRLQILWNIFQTAIQGDSLSSLLMNWKWITLTHLSADFLFWYRVCYIREHTPSSTDGYNPPLVHLPSMKHHSHTPLYMTHFHPVVVQNNILYMLVQLNQSSLEGKQHVQ